MEKKRVKFVLIEITYLIFQIIFSLVNLFGFLSPVGISFAFVRLLTGGNIFFVTAEYLISKSFGFGSLNKLFVTLYEVVFLALFYLTKEFVKTNKKLLLSIGFLLVSSVLSLYFSLHLTSTLIHYLINLVSSILLCIYFYKFNQTYKNKFIFYKFSNNDYLMFSIFVLLTSIGLFSIPVLDNILGLLLITVLAVLLVKVLPSDKYYLLIGFMSIGAVIQTLEYFYIIYAFLLAVCLSQFKNLSKYFYAIATTLILAFFMVVFKIYDVFSLISIYFAVFVYMILPNRIVTMARDMFEAGSQNLIYKYVERYRSKSIQNKLLLMSNTLFSMQKDFKFLLVGKIDREKASIELSGDIISKCCETCENYKTCFMGNINKRMLFENLIRLSIDKGEVQKNDITNGLGSYCSKSGIVVSEINQIAKQFLMYEKAMKSEDASKLMISNELGNFADIFNNFAKIMGKNLNVNARLSAVLKEKFISSMIDVKEVLISEGESGIDSIYVIASNEQALKKELVECISKVTKNKVKVKEVKHLEYSGLSLITFIPSTMLRADFAISTKAKEVQNGDNSLVTKLNENKYFVAIADGMGHGESANKISTMVLSLIRSMFEVGLDDELILQSVNKLLLPAGLDNFTTLDACIIDLEQNLCNFIKLGSSVSVIKHANTSETVVCESLPIGIVQNIKPTIIKKQIAAGDTIILASDGVVDAFSSVEMYQNYINDSEIGNLQRYTNEVLFDAENQKNVHADDMTIIAINLLKN